MTNLQFTQFTTDDGKKYCVADWVIRKNCDGGLITDLAAGLLEVAKETEKAICFKGTYGSFWTPKSQMREVEA